MKEEDRGVRGNLLFCEKWSLLFMVLMSNITIKKKQCAKPALSGNTKVSWKLKE